MASSVPHFVGQKVSELYQTLFSVSLIYKISYEADGTCRSGYSPSVARKSFATGLLIRNPSLDESSLSREQSI